MSNSDLDSKVDAISPEIYRVFKSSVAIRRWPNGVAMTDDQIQTCLQAIIAYEHRHVPVEERTGYVPPKKQACEDDSHIHTHETPLKWQN